MNEQAITDRYNRARADIAAIADWFEIELAKEVTCDATRAKIVMIEHVRGNMIEALSIFSGVDQPAIQRSLDELHS